MDIILVILVVNLLDYVCSDSTLSKSEAIAGSEIVWLKDVNAKFQTQKRIFGDPDLPDHLTFHVMRGSGVLTLKLKRNYEIDPNADIYLVERTKDGRSKLSKATTLEREVSFN
ncbi:hypothetical protein CHS0354_010462 [Potamilus streckersoni]|uniref:Uncharacterized protein n=1 Tax=Potamilus streckersoni TaxID=2493646 RepID=A0AAE0WC37_9BIVA|nr:hypothetical protein CHS0354_010462 [Potamilus streckersoni]